MSQFLRKKYLLIIAIITVVLVSTGVFMVGENHFVKNEDIKAFVLFDDQSNEEHDEKFYKELLQTEDDRFLILETDVMIKYATKKFINEIKLDEEKIIGNNFFSLVHPQDLPFIANSFIEILDTAEINDNIGPFRMNNSEEQSTLYMAKAIPVFNKEHKIILIGLILRDISNPLGGEQENKDLSNVDHDELANLVTMSE